MTDLFHTRKWLAAAAATFALHAAPAFAQQAATVTVALDWTPNTNHVGLFVAQNKGFYDAHGLDVEILPYTDTSAGTLVANGVADFGVLGSISLFTQGTAGADLVATYAIVQSETGRLVYSADRADITTPSDLDGMTYGGFGSAWETALIETIIEADGGEGNFETVTLGTSAYQALANGAVDFTLEVSTWEGVQAELEGTAQSAFRYADYGVPDQHTNFIGSSSAYLDANEELAASFIEATYEGYAYAVAHPEEAAEILVEENPDALTNPELVRASMQALIEGDYLKGEDGTIGLIDPEKMQRMGTFLFENGILRDADGDVAEDAPDFSRFYTNRFIEPAL